jgi:hypothetical protein
VTCPPRPDRGARQPSARRRAAAGSQAAGKRVCEYWDVREQRWRLVDAQIDAVQLGWFDIDFDLTDVPRDQFLTGGDATLADLRQLCDDDRLRVPPEVRNAVRGRLERV